MQRYNRGERLWRVKHLKNKRRNYWGYGKPFSHKGMSQVQQGKVSQNPAICSCFLCSSNRYRYGNSKKSKTLRELSDMELIQKGLI